VTQRSQPELAALHDARRRAYAEAHHRVDASKPADQVAAEVLSLWFA
jgi:hypothetical protein